MAGYQRLPPGPAAADVLAAALSSASLSPFATLDGQLGDKSVHGGDEPICPRTGSIHIGPSQSKFSRPLEVRSKQHAASSGILIAKWVILPDSTGYHNYWKVTVAAAFLTAIFEPFMFGFKDNPGLSPYLGIAAWFEYLLFILFAIDLVLNFLVAYPDPAQQVLVTDPAMIRKHYLRPGGFWFDVWGVLPVDYIVLACMGLESAGPNSVTASAVETLRWLRLVRCRRILTLFEEYELDVRISQIWVTLMRNQCFLFFLLHGSACTFFWIARLHRFSDNSWVGSSYNTIADMDILSQYVFSLYWSTITFSTVGYGDLHAVSTLEAAFTVLYCFINVVVASYIIGTITVLVVKRDETTRDYRYRLAVLDAYNKEHNLPKELKRSMQDHLELHLHFAEVKDESVLSVYPATIRRRILRYLYIPILTRCQLLAGCAPRFLDTLLAIARVELFMGKVEVLAEGDQVHDLHILLAGSMEQLRSTGMWLGLTRASSMSRASMTNGKDRVSGSGLMRQDSGLSWPLTRQDSLATTTAGMGFTSNSGTWGGPEGTVSRGRRRLILPGVAFGELPFFTMTPNQEAVRTLETCRVLVVARTAWDKLIRDYPLAATHVLGNLQLMCELEVVQELRGIYQAAARAQEAPATQYPHTHTQPPTVLDTSATHIHDTDPYQDSDDSADNQELQAAVYQLMYRYGGTMGFGTGHGGGAKGPLALAALSARQRAAVADLMRVRALAAAQADATQAARTHEFLSAASRGDATRVREMLMQGQAVDVADYDNRTALMLACAAGHVSVARILLEVGADPRRRDALGGTAALGAAKAGHDAILTLLKERNADLALEPATLAGILCRCAAEGDTPLLKRLLSVGGDAGAADYDGRTALHVAAGCGNQPAVQLLLAHGADPMCEDNFGCTPLDDARRDGSRAVLSMLESALKDPEDAKRALAKFELRRAERLLQACARGDEEFVRESLDTGCPVDACDYDARAGLELAAAAGHLDVVRLLLSRGADVNRSDRVESCALLEACKGGHREVIDELVAAGGRLGSSPRVAALLCQAVSSGEVSYLDCLLRAHADPLAADYDKRTAAHIAAADGQIESLQLLLVAPGAADAAAVGTVAAAVRAARDRWEHTPYDEARAAGHWKCAELLLEAQEVRLHPPLTFSA